MGAGSKGDEKVEMQVAQFGWRETAIAANAGQDLARFDPIIFRRSQDGMISRQKPEKHAI